MGFARPRRAARLQQQVGRRGESAEVECGGAVEGRLATRDGCDPRRGVGLPLGKLPEGVSEASPLVRILVVLADTLEELTGQGDVQVVSPGSQISEPQRDL